MTQGVQDLIKAINSGDSTEIDSVFQAEMANRISTRLEDMRVSVAQGMFATEQSVEETEVEEGELTLEDYSVEEIEEFMQTEDFEQLDELSKKTLGSYINRAAGNTGKGKGQDWPHDNNLNYAAQSYGTEKDDDDEPGDEDSPAANTVSKRLRGIKMAVNKLTKKAGKK
jgi:hypothetical protein